MVVLVFLSTAVVLYPAIPGRPTSGANVILAPGLITDATSIATQTSYVFGQWKAGKIGRSTAIVHLNDLLAKIDSRLEGWLEDHLTHHSEWGIKYVYGLETLRSSVVKRLEYLRAYNSSILNEPEREYKLATSYFMEAASLASEGRETINYGAYYDPDWAQDAYVELDPSVQTMKSSAESDVKISLTVKEWGFNGTMGGVEWKGGPRLEIRAGQTVQVTVRNEGYVWHNFAIRALNSRNNATRVTLLVMTSPIHPDEEETIIFKMERKGTYRYQCVLKGHFNLGMTGELIVK